MEGWIKIHRKFLTWQWWDKPEMTHLFLYILLRANHENGKWHDIDISRGQLITGLKSLSKETGLSIMTVRSCIKRLKLTSEITSKVTNKYRIITITNYESYQGLEKETNRLINRQSNKKLTSNQQATNNKQEGRECKEEVIYSIFYDEQINIAKEKNDLIYPAFVEWLFKNNPNKVPLKRVLSMDNQITYDRLHKLLSENKPDYIKQKILAIENDGKHKYSSFNLTLNNWLKNVPISSKI